MVWPHHVGRFAGPRQQPLFRIAVGIALLGPRGGLLPSTFLGAVLALLGLILLCLKARIGGAIGDQERGQHGGHVAAGSIMLAQEARQRRGRNGLEKATGALVAGVTGARENLRRGLAGLEILHRTHRHRRETADHKRHRR